MRRSLALLCSVVAACGSGTDANGDGIADGIRSPDSVSVVGPSSPVGTLSGQVLYTDFRPLNAVKVSVIVGGATAESKTFTAETDNEGIWAIKGVPAATQVQVLLAKEGFSTARVNATVPGNAGNFPVNNGNANVGTVMLTELNGTFKVQVVTAGGQPAKGVKCLIEATPSAVRYSDFSASYGNQVGIFVTSVDTNDQGMVLADKVPNISELSRLDGRFSVTIAGYDANGDMRIDYLGTRRDFQARDLFTGSASSVITLPAARAPGPIRVIASNVDSMVNGVGDPLRSMISMGNTLYFVFDQAFLIGSVNAKVTDETGISVMAANKMELAPNILQINLNGPIENGKEYNIALRATSAENGSTFQQSAYFFGGDPAMPKMFAIEKITYRRPAGNPSTGMRLELGDRVIVTFNQPIRQVLSQQVEVLIELDLDGMGGRGNALGEKSLMGAMTPNTSGFPLFANEPVAEPMSTFSNMPSGYTTRYEFTYNGLGYLNVPVGTNFHVFFSEIPSSLFGYRTLWGTGIELDATAVLSSP